MRRYLLTELDPRWADHQDPDNADVPGVADAISFECPEAGGGCGGRHCVPFKPALDGSARATGWTRSGGGFATLTLTPSIQCRGACQWHGFIEEGRIKFCEDSKAGPDWSTSEGS